MKLKDFIQNLKRSNLGITLKEFGTGWEVFYPEGGLLGYVGAVNGQCYFVEVPKFNSNRPGSTMQTFPGGGVVIRVRRPVRIKTITHQGSQVVATWTELSNPKDDKTFVVDLDSKTVKQDITRATLRIPGSRVVDVPSDSDSE